jgi:transcriptional regulator with XRE-family HTH domain
LGKRVRIEDWETPEGLALLRSMAKLKLEEIAGIIGISRTTLNKWCIRSESINDALRQKLDEETARRVEQAVIDSCFDRKVKVKIKKQVVDREGVVHDLEETKEQVIPADTRAQRFVLTNRLPRRWTDKPEPAEDDGAVGAAFIPIPIEADLNCTEDPDG